LSESTGQSAAGGCFRNATGRTVGVAGCDVGIPPVGIAGCDVGVPPLGGMECASNGCCAPAARAVRSAASCPVPPTPAPVWQPLAQHRPSKQTAADRCACRTSDTNVPPWTADGFYPQISQIETEMNGADAGGRRPPDHLCKSVKSVDCIFGTCAPSDRSRVSADTPPRLNRHMMKCRATVFGGIVRPCRGGRVRKRGGH
jgi:hypothetical protein